VAQDDDDQSLHPEQHSNGIITDPHSRRRFLRAAVVGTAGVAGAAGVAGVALAHRSNNSPSILRTFAFAQQQQTPVAACSAGLEIPGLDANEKPTSLPGTCITHYSGFKGPYALVFLASQLPAGSYTFDVTQTFTPSGGSPTTGAIQPNGTTNPALPWDLDNTSNLVFINQVAAGTGSACPSGAFPSMTSTLPASYALASTMDVEIWIPIIFEPSGTIMNGDTSSFTSTTSTASGIPICNSTVTSNAIT
jgi:hypothetical protein